MQKIFFDPLEILYSPHYQSHVFPNDFEKEKQKYLYRHVILPHKSKENLRTLRDFSRNWVDKNILLTEEQCKQMGIQQSEGWEHYAYFTPEPFVLLFRKKF